MDAINQAIAQLGELFRSMSPGSRITAGLLLIVAVVSVGYLFQYQVTGGDEFLFNDVSVESETLNKMEAAWGKAGLNSHTIVGGKVKVPHSARAQYMAAIADAGIQPPHAYHWYEEAENKGSMIEPPSQRQERMKIALERELASVIGSMQGIESATVLLDQQSQPFPGEPPLKTASVFARTLGGSRLDREQAKKIACLLIGAFAGLKRENVTVVDPAGPVILSSDDNSENEYQLVTHEAEANLREKVLSALSYIRGVTATATVIIDTQKSLHRSDVKHDPKTVTERVVEENVTDNSETAPPGGPAGALANTPNSVAGAGGNQAKPLTRQKESSKNDSVNLVSTTLTQSESAGFTPKRASVTVGIPNSYYESVWRDRNPVKPGEEAKKTDPDALTAINAIKTETEANVKKTILTLLPPVEGLADMNELVQVASFQDIKMPEIAQTPATQTVAVWFAQNWRTLGIGGLVMVSLLMLRSMIRTIPAPEPEVAQARVSAGESGDSHEEPVEAAAAKRLRRIKSGGPSLRDELSELVKEDPDSAANILRAWIGTAS